MPARLFCKTGQLAGASYVISGEATIGNSPGNTIQLYPGVVSGKHARIFFDAKSGKYVLEDLGSRNGTKLDGLSVKGKEKLDRLHIITFAGQLDFIFQMLDETVETEKGMPAAPGKSKTVRSSPRKAPSQRKEPAPESGKTVVDPSFAVMPEFRKSADDQPALRDPGRTVVGDDYIPLPEIGEGGGGESEGAPPEDVEAQDVRYDMEIRNLPSAPPLCALKPGENIIGRDPACEIVLDDASLSRQHAVITVKEGGVYVKDLGSKNHTFLDSQRVTYETQVKPGATLSFGMVQAVIRKRS